jgi:hypothetical protein
MGPFVATVQRHSLTPLTLTTTLHINTLEEDGLRMKVLIQFVCYNLIPKTRRGALFKSRAYVFGRCRCEIPYRHIYRVIQEERSVFWEVIVSVIVSKKFI